MISEDADWKFTTIPALCARAAEVYGTRTALEDNGVVLNFVELDAMRKRAAKRCV